jgi:uncharacterized membrane protein
MIGYGFATSVIFAYLFIITGKHTRQEAKEANNGRFKIFMKILGALFITTVIFFVSSYHSKSVMEKTNHQSLHQRLQAGETNETQKD